MLLRLGHQITCNGRSIISKKVIFLLLFRFSLHVNSCYLLVSTQPWYSALVPLIVWFYVLPCNFLRIERDF